MQNTPPEQALLKQPQVIKPACVNDAGKTPTADLEGYVVHTGRARSIEDVSVRRGTAPILTRGDAGEDEDAGELLDEVTLAAGGAPD